MGTGHRGKHDGAGDRSRRHVPSQLAAALGAAAEGAWLLARRRQPPPVTRYGVALLGGENRFAATRARRELGFSPLLGLAEGVRRSVSWYLADGGRHGTALVAR